MAEVVGGISLPFIKRPVKIADGAIGSDGQVGHKRQRLSLQPLERVGRPLQRLAAPQFHGLRLAGRLGRHVAVQYVYFHSACFVDTDAEFRSQIDDASARSVEYESSGRLLHTDYGSA